jgi:hypothetical protein
MHSRLRFITQYLLPIEGAIFFALTQLWDFPYGDIIVGIIVTMNAALGLVLGYISKTPYDGSLEINEFADGRKRYSLNLDAELDELDQKKHVIFKVHNFPRS